MNLQDLDCSIYKRKAEQGVSKNRREKWSRRMYLEPKKLHARSV